MPFLLSTSKEPGATLGVATGHFLATRSLYAAVNRINSLCIYKVENNDVDNNDTALTMVQDFHMNCTIKYVQTLAIVDPSTKRVVRNVLFLLSVKQEASIVALLPSDSASGGLVMETLFSSTVQDCLYQYYPGEVDLVCSTPPDQSVLTPFVAFGINRGELMILDVLAAIGQYRSKQKKGAFGTLFSKEVLALMDTRAKNNCFSKSAFDASEYEVRDIAFTSPSPQEDSLLCVLYADIHNRTHVSLYAFNKDIIDITKPSHAATAPLTHLDGILDAYDRRTTRKGMLVSNADQSASRLVPLRGAVLIVGSQLVTLVSRLGKQSTPPVSRELTASSSAELACVCPAHEDGAFVCFKDGSCALVSRALGGSELRVTQLPHQLSTIASSMAAVGQDWVLVTSRLDNTILARLSHDSKEHLIIENCGPVMDIAVVREGNRSTVVASTGVGASGGLSLVRSAVSVVEDFAVPVPFHATAVFSAHQLVVVTSDVVNRYYIIDPTGSGSFTEATFGNSPPPPSLHGIVQLFYDAAQCYYTLMSSAGATRVAVSGGSHLQIKDTFDFGVKILFAAARGDIIAISDGEIIRVVTRNFKDVRSWRTRGCISCAAFVSDTLLAYGDWEGHLNLLDTRKGETVIGLTLSSVPRSISIIIQDGSKRIFVGLINGCIVETSIKMLASSTPFQEVFIMNQPVECVPIASRNCLVCLGDVPMLMLLSDKGVQLTGLSICGLTDCCSLEALPGRHLFLSRQTCTLVVGSLKDVQRTNRTQLKMGTTVTRVSHIREWGGFVVSQRRPETDEITYVPFDLVESPWKVKSHHVKGVSLLENERCVFIEPLVLGGSNDGPNGDGVDSFTAGDERFVVLVGSTFTFPDEQRARSSRITWYHLEEGQLVELSSKDIVGQLQCCCPVPRYRGRIALGVSGGIQVFNWNTNEKVFTAEERCTLGMTIVKLIPLYTDDLSQPKKHIIVALDTRHSAFFVSVDPLQGSIECLGRDPHPRGIMDGVALSHTQVCVCDDNMNFFCVSRDGDPTKNRRLVTTAQCHVGDHVTSMGIGTLALPMVSSPTLSSHQIVAGPQVVYGTSSGSFGMITPISQLSYLLMKALEIAVCHTTSTPLGGFHHDEFREVMFTGQEKATNRNLSFLVASNRHKRLYESRGVCHGDVIERFGSLSSPDKAIVAKAAQRIIVHVLLQCQGHTDLEAILDQLSSLNTSVLLQSTAPQNAKSYDSCNATLATEQLPQLPLSVPDIQQYIHILQRIH